MQHFWEVMAIGADAHKRKVRSQSPYDYGEAFRALPFFLRSTGRTGCPADPDYANRWYSLEVSQKGTQIESSVSSYSGYSGWR